jgi:hypothetical protein
MMAQTVAVQPKQEVKPLSTGESILAKLAARQKLSFPKK